jgi:MtrB/PioB family decaheme-associated outer membrane protein
MKRLANNTSNRVLKRTTLSLALAMAFAPLAGYAQVTGEPILSNEVELGVGHVNRDSWKFGEYNGLGDKGAYLIGNIDLRSRNRDTARFWGLRGSNLGLDTRNLQFDIGTQGRYRFWAEYDQIEKRGNDTGRTLYNGAGSGTLSLPAGFAGIATTDTTAALRAAKVDPFLQKLDLRQERKNYIAGFSTELARGWQASARVRHERKEGIRLQGGVFGNSGGNPRSSLIPEPVDYETNELEAAVEYATQKMQVRVTYTLSHFSNDNAALTWPNPYQQIAGWATSPLTGFPTGIGQLALPPDNQAHHLGVNGGYNLSQTTRLGYTLAFGRMTQNEPFLPYAATPGIVINTPLPRSSLDGKANTTLANLNVTSRVLPTLTLRGSYKYDERDDKTPQAQYIYVGGDSMQQLGVATPRARTNLPLSHKQHLVKLDADYRAFAGIKLNAGYDYDQIHRTNEEAAKTKEHTVRLGARRTLSDTVTGAVSYAHSRRRYDNYHDIPFEESFSPEYRATLAANVAWDNNPLVRKYPFSNRDRDRLKFNLNASPLEKVALGFAADYYNDDYKSDKSTLLGRQDAKGTTYTLDAGFTPVDNVTTYAFYTHDNYKSRQQGRSATAATKAASGLEGPFATDWWVNVNNKANTVGIGFKVNEFRSRIDFGGDLFYTTTTGHIEPTHATLTLLPLPDNKTRLAGLQLFAKYQLQKNGWLRLSFLHQKYKESDWAWDNVSPTLLANVITTGQQPPDYTVSVVGLSYIYRFQ